ncbi:hypothetical protein Leryth_024703 [Lithospermum erythrorhizon]|nr:hypothetical protein Leryth_024703 [Lithospermum erythrorhizon]
MGAEEPYPPRCLHADNDTDVTETLWASVLSATNIIRLALVLLFHLGFPDGVHVPIMTLLMVVGCSSFGMAHVSLVMCLRWIQPSTRDGHEYGGSFPFMELFTWTNGSIWSKLDRVLINNVWSSLDLTCSASFLPMEPALKAPLKALNRDEFGSIFEKAKEANVAFKDAVQAHMDDPLNVTLKSKCHELGKGLISCVGGGEDFIDQKSLAMSFY